MRSATSRPGLKDRVSAVKAGLRGPDAKQQELLTHHCCLHSAQWQHITPGRISRAEVLGAQ